MRHPAIRPPRAPISSTGRAGRLTGQRSYRARNHTRLSRRYAAATIHSSGGSARLQRYQDRRQILPALDAAMHTCGCWVLTRGTLSSSQVELVFEIHLRSAFDLYGALIGAGVELTRDSHAALTGLCTLRRHHPASHPSAGGTSRIVTIRLEVSFFNEDDIELDAVGLA